MAKAPKYKFLQEASVDITQTCPIQILEGKFSGIVYRYGQISFKETESKILLATLGKYFKHLLTLNKSDHLLIHSKLDDVNIVRNRTADITYGDYANNNGVNFSTFREIIVSEKNKLDVQLNFKQYEFNKELVIIFNIPANYTRK